MGRYANRAQDDVMATNPAAYYGKDLACVADCDELFSEVEGIKVVVQDAIHVLTNDNFLGPGGIDRGYDCRKLLGATQRELTLAQPIITEVLCRDDRIDTADVELTAVSRAGVIDAELNVTLYTALGAYSFTRLLSELTDTELESLP